MKYNKFANVFCIDFQKSLPIIYFYECQITRLLLIWVMQMQLARSLLFYYTKEVISFRIKVVFLPRKQFPSHQKYRLILIIIYFVEITH